MALTDYCGAHDLALDKFGRCPICDYCEHCAQPTHDGECLTIAERRPAYDSEETTTPHSEHGEASR